MLAIRIPNAMTGRYAMRIAACVQREISKFRMIFYWEGLGVIMIAETMGNIEEGTDGKQKKTRGTPMDILAMFRRDGCTEMFVNGWRFHMVCLR